MYGDCGANGCAGDGNEEVLIVRSSRGGSAGGTADAAERRISTRRRSSTMSSESLPKEALSFLLDIYMRTFLRRMPDDGRDAIFLRLSVPLQRSDFRGCEQLRLLFVELFLGDLGL